MDCLQDYIGIGFCGDAPASGLYITSLPGITLESIDKIATEDQVTYAKVWEDAQKEAAIRFKSDFIAKVNECFEINTECDYEDFICENKDKLVNSWRFLLGNQLMIYRIYSTRLNRFTTIDIEAATELKDYYQSEYDKYLHQEVKFIDFSSCCMPCGGNPQVVHWLP
jgi:hypothetical protein